MSETTEAIEQKVEKPAIASRGNIERVGPTQAQPAPATQTKEETSAPPAVTGETNPPAPTEAPDLTDDQLKAYFQKQGIEYEGVDKLKEKLIAPAASTELTPEQKEAQAKEEDKRILDYYIENGGTAESYVGLKNILAQDLAELSVAAIKGEMKEAGFDEADIEAVLKERYYQINVDELEQGDTESDEDFAARKALVAKKVAYGAKKMVNRSTHIKTQAENVINGVKEALKFKDAEKQNELILQSNVDKVLKELPRKMTFELGKVNDTAISPVDHEVSEESIAKVTAVLKDPAQRNQFLFNQDGSLNVSKIAEMMVRNEELERVAKGSLLEGQTRQVAIFQKTFPNSPHALGVGGSSAKDASQKGAAVSRGAVQRTKQPTR